VFVFFSFFISDPDGECLDIDDLRSVWEEFVDALRDATGASEAYSDNEKYTSNSYQSLEKPVMKRNESFHKLAQDLNELVVQKSPGSSRGGSTHGIQRISSKGMLLGIGCSSREPSLRGGNEWAKMKSEMSSGSVGKKIGEDCGRQVIRFSERVYMLRARCIFSLFPLVILCFNDIISCVFNLIRAT